MSDQDELCPDQRLGADRVIDGLRSCGCGREGCDRMECITCGCSDCKWPGACYGKCRECGGAARANRLPMANGEPFLRQDGRPYMDSYCSQECQDICLLRAEDAGLVVSFSDVTLERANELLNTAGLALVGVGPVVVS
jgi:hypothetical protein